MTADCELGLGRPRGLLRRARGRQGPRSFWLDGIGSRAWSGRMTYVGWLSPDDVSLDVRRDSRRRSRAYHGDVERAWSATTSSRCWRTDWRGRVRHGGSPRHRPGWVGCFGYASRPDLPALDRQDRRRPRRVLAAGRADGRLRPRRAARCSRSRRRTPGVARGGRALLAATPTAPPPDRRVGPRRGRRHARPRRRTPRPSCGSSPSCDCGNSYETNLTYRTEVESGLDPVDAYRRLRALSPAPYAAFDHASRHAAC